MREPENLYPVPLSPEVKEKHLTGVFWDKMKQLRDDVQELHKPFLGDFTMVSRDEGHHKIFDSYCTMLRVSKHIHSSQATEALKQCYECNESILREVLDFKEEVKEAEMEFSLKDLESIRDEPINLGTVQKERF